MTKFRTGRIVFSPNRLRRFSAEEQRTLARSLRRSVKFIGKGKPVEKAQAPNSR